MAKQPAHTVDSVRATLRDALIDLLGVDGDAITDDANLIHDLNADELDIVELAMTCEDALGVALDDGDLDAVKTVRDFLALLTRACGL